MSCSKWLTRIAGRSVVLATAVLALLAPPASAAPVTINFQGQFSFFDSDWQTFGCAAFAEQCAFVQGLAAVGINEGSPFGFSLTLNGQVNSATATGALTLGQNTYDLGPTPVAVSGSSVFLFAHALTGPSLVGNGITLLPNFIQFGLSGLSFGSSALSSLDISNPSGWSLSPFFVSFASTLPGSQANLGISTLRVTSVSVPEAGTLASLAAGLMAFGALRFRTLYAGRS